MDYRNRYAQWVESNLLNDEEKEELLLIKNDEMEKEERFYQYLEFGTAGLRGILGLGTNRMNKMVVRRAARGLGAHLKTCKGVEELKVAIAFDSRNQSEALAKETASTLAQMGIKCYFFEALHPVPMLSFAVLHHGCAAGVVITASHNPPEYNGFKVYWEDGGQIGPECASAIMQQIQAADELSPAGLAFDEAVHSGLIVLIGQETDDVYYKETIALLQNPELARERGGDISIVYTPLHGSGLVPVTTLLQRAGFTNVHVVEEQRLPDGAFPTVKAPNPEDPDAFCLAFELADRTGADLCIATDPDADRTGLAVRCKDGCFYLLSGNQIGCLLLYYLLTCKDAKSQLTNKDLVVRSFVSTRLADAICKEFGVELQEVLTGFRFISSIIAECENGRDNRFLFGFEESYGYLAGTVSRDKDAVCSCMLLCEAALYYSTQGKCLYDVLEEIWQRFGYYKEATRSYTLQGKAGLEKIAQVMVRLRQEDLCEIGGEQVLAISDHLAQAKKNCLTGERFKLPLNKANAISYALKHDGFVCIRPSGTEPKLKYYVGVKDGKNDASQAKLTKVMEAIKAKIEELIQD